MPMTKNGKRRDEPRLPDGGDDPESSCRELIYDYIRANPGVNMSQVREALDLGWGTVAWHVRILDDDNRIATRERGRETALLPRELSGPGNEALSLFHKPQSRKIIDTVLQDPGIRRPQLPDETGQTRRVAYYHLEHLFEYDLVERREGSGGQGLYPTEQLEELAGFVKAPQLA